MWTRRQKSSEIVNFLLKLTCGVLTGNEDFLVLSKATLTFGHRRLDNQKIFIRALRPLVSALFLHSNILVFYPWLLPTVGRDLYQITKTAQSAPCKSAAFSDSVHNLWIAISRCCHNIILQKSKNKWTKRKGFYLNLALDKINTIFWHIPW